MTQLSAPLFLMLGASSLSAQSFADVAAPDTAYACTAYLFCDADDNCTTSAAAFGLRLAPNSDHLSSPDIALDFDDLQIPLLRTDIGYSDGAAESAYASTAPLEGVAVIVAQFNDGPMIELQMTIDNADTLATCLPEVAQ